jgi:ABC-type polysaccharide/polyol phosphate export permease
VTAEIVGISRSHVRRPSPPPPASTAPVAPRPSGGGPVIRSIRELWEYRYLIWNLAQRDLRSRYKKSVLGWLWSLLNPASTLIIYTVVFGTLLQNDPLPADNGTRIFGLYLFAGLVVWNFFNLVVTGSITALASSGQLLKKVYFPPSAPAVANLLTSLSQVLIEMAILALFMVAFGNASFYMFLFPVVVVLTGLFALGLGLWVSILNLFYRDVGYLVTIALNVWFYATPVIYPIELAAKHQLFGVRVDTILLANPITDLVEINRQLFYFNRWPDLWHLTIVVVATAASLVFGTFMFNRKAQYVSEEV